MTIFNKKTIIEVDAFDLNEFIQEAFGLDDFEGTLESPNDSTHSFTVTKDEPDKWEAEALENFIKQKGCEHYSLGTILCALCRQDKIEPGDYLVSVCW